MSEKTNPHQNLTLHPIDLESVTKLINGHFPPKFKGLGVNAALLHVTRVRGRGRFQLSAPDQRVFIHIQTKNKHPHSTKKHK
jgi:hypothetical protein